MKKPLAGIAGAIIIATSFPVLAKEKPRTWAALTLYNSGRVAVTENLRAERTCREVLCMVRDSMTCAEKAEMDNAASERAKAAEAAHEKAKADYRLDHPCETKFERLGKDPKRAISRCPIPEGGEEVFDTETKTLLSTTGGLSGTTTNWITRGEFVAKQACFQEDAR